MMGLLQKALETYDAMQMLAGVYEEGKEPLAPIGHIVTRAQIEITINANGCFVEAKAADKDQKIIIPVTEESSGRTSSPAAHALCDQLGYLSGKDTVKLSLYTEQLKKWVNSEYTHPKAAAVLRYVLSGTIGSDLQRSDLSVKDEKAMICWRVIGLGADSGPVWTDISLMQAYERFYLSQMEGDKTTCMLTGEDTYITWQHLKGAFSLNGNAKIISANDTVNFTYRGRFAEREEAASVGYVASQKAHNALKWLISTQGTIQGGRAFVCWNPKGYSVPNVQMPLLFASDEAESVADYKSYRDVLRKKLAGYQSKLTTNSQVVIAAFDAATTGRLAITYYNELMGSDFLERLAQWDESCCWPYSSKSISSPALKAIVDFAFGTPKGTPEKVNADDAIVPGHMQRLLSCRIDQAAFPLDIMRALVTRSGNMQVYEKRNRGRLLYITCAAIQKYYIDHNKEAFDLALEPARKDRSYQWGRMLAVLEKVERDTYDASEGRETNAIRMQSVFVRRPGYAFKIIMDQLKNAYFPRLTLGRRIYYERLIGEIMEQLSDFSPEEYGKPLTETYLPGYYLQKNAFYTKTTDEEAEDENNEV